MRPLSNVCAPLSSYFIFLGTPKLSGSGSDVIVIPTELLPAMATQFVARMPVAIRVAFAKSRIAQSLQPQLPLRKQIIQRADDGATTGLLSVAQRSPGGAIMRCMKVEEIAEAVAKLPPDQLARFRRWFIAFEAGRTDHAEELDTTANKLGRLAGRAFAELKKRAKEL